MVKPKRDLSSEFTPRQPAAESKQADSMKTALAGPVEVDPLRHLTIQIPESMRQQLKVRAAAEGTSVRNLVTQAIEEALRDR